MIQVGADLHESVVKVHNKLSDLVTGESALRIGATMLDFLSLQSVGIVLSIRQVLAALQSAANAQVCMCYGLLCLTVHNPTLLFTELSLTLQAAVHLLQSEGSKMVLALCESSYNQGVYGLVTNLGSLVVRTIFFPVEEAAFRAFSSPTGRFCVGALWLLPWLLV